MGAHAFNLPFVELNSASAGESEGKTQVPQRSDCASDSLINGLSIDISAPSPALTIHADPKNNTPAPDLTIKGEGGRQARRVSRRIGPKMVSKKDSKIRDLLGLPSYISLPQVATSLFALVHMKAWMPPSETHVGFLAPPFWRRTSCSFHPLSSKRNYITRRCTQEVARGRDIFVVLIIRITITTILQRVWFASDSFGASLVAQMVKHLPAMQKTWVRSLGQEDPLEKEMATLSSTLAWKIPWTEEPGRLQSMGSQRVGQD